MSKLANSPNRRQALVSSQSKKLESKSKLPLINKPTNFSLKTFEIPTDMKKNIEPRLRDKKTVNKVNHRIENPIISPANNNYKFNEICIDQKIKNYGLPVSEQEMKAIEASHNIALVKESDTYNLDICFMLDCTGSMSEYITMAKEKIGEIMQQMKAQYAESIVRIGIVCYRDVNDKERFDILDFTTSPDIARAFLNKQKAFGGHDIPEDVNGAMQLALYKMDWQYPTRMLYHIADAPCHGKDFHKNKDDYPNGYKEDANWERLMQGLKNMDVSYTFFDIDSLSKYMYHAFNKLYMHTPNKDYLIFSYEVIKRIPTIVKDGADSKHSRVKFAGSLDSNLARLEDKASKDEVYKKFSETTVNNAILTRSLYITMKESGKLKS